MGFPGLIVSEQGFTLSEILLTIAILSILTAIAVPTLLTQRGQAKDGQVTNVLYAQVKEVVKPGVTAADVETLIADQPTSGGVELRVVVIDDIRYCLAAHHKDGKAYTADTPFVYDSSMAIYSSPEEGRSLNCDDKF